MINILITLQAITAFALFGLIWVIQLVHYPAFRYVDEQQFIKFEKYHTRNISLIVIPLMLIELVTALILFLQSPR